MKRMSGRLIPCPIGASERPTRGEMAYCRNVLIENRNGLVVDTELWHCNGTAEWDK
jgi:hypothetical protein